MQIYRQRQTLQEALTPCRLAGRTIGLVPTMGNLHDGHLALVAMARKHCDFVLASIFVNPLQFGAGEDFNNYPRTPDADIDRLAQGGCDAVFLPAVPEMYPDGLENQTLVTVPGLSERHCGRSRPGHFSGVCTVVSKLFNLTQPDMAFFGEKDYQQLQVIRRMTIDLCFPVRIVGVPTIRTPAGLAMSSRNGYLDAAQLVVAANLYRCLKETAAKIRQGATAFGALEQEAEQFLASAGLTPDYIHISHAATLEPAQPQDRHLVILAAARVGTTRLIDNIRIDLDP